MSWLLLLSAMTLFALACLSSHAGLLSTCLLLSLLAALGWARCLMLGQTRQPLQGLSHPHPINRPGAEPPGEES